MIIGGIYFEVQAPGIGLPLGIAITGALLYFAPLYIEGLANHWEILLFIVGLILIVLEIFVIPGFGVTGVSGIILVIAGLILSMLNNVGFDFTYTTSNQLIVAFSVVLIAMFVGLITSFFLGQKLITSNRFTELSLQDIQESSKGFTVVKEETKNLLGQQGITQTIMRPTGRIIIDNNVFQATALTGYIDKDQQVKVVDIIHNQLVVEKV